MNHTKNYSVHPILQLEQSLSHAAPLFQVKDPISALTHFIGFLCAILALPVLLIHGASHFASDPELISLSLFMVSMIFLYGASTSYHTFQLSPKNNKILKKIDHSMIFFLIAGSYTPVCVMVLSRETGIRLLWIVWLLAVIGVVFKLFWVTCPKWISSVIYIGMGWLCLMAFSEIYRSMPGNAFLFLLIGGIIYTMGGIVYALKLPLLSKWLPGFGAHELFHVFVLGGSLCHYISIYLLISGR